jgi:hypothetical protein
MKHDLFAEKEHFIFRFKDKPSYGKIYKTYP